jgi:hypothetical protein
MRFSFGLIVISTMCLTPTGPAFPQLPHPVLPPSASNPQWSDWEESGIPNALVRFGCAGPTAFSGNRTLWYVELWNRMDENLRVSFVPYVYGQTRPNVTGKSGVIAPGSTHRAEGLLSANCGSEGLLHLASSYRFEPVPGSRSYVAPKPKNQTPRAKRPAPGEGVEIEGGLNPNALIREREAREKREADERRRKVAQQQRNAEQARERERVRQEGKAEQQRVAEARDNERRQAAAAAAEQRQAAAAQLEEQRLLAESRRREERARLTRANQDAQRRAQLAAITESRQMVADFKAQDNADVERERARIQADLEGDARAIESAYEYTTPSGMHAAAERLRARADRTSKDKERTWKVSNGAAALVRGFGRAITGDTKAGEDYGALAETVKQMAAIHDERRQRLDEAADQIDEAATALEGGA